MWLEGAAASPLRNRKARSSRRQVWWCSDLQTFRALGATCNRLHYLPLLTRRRVQCGRRHSGRDEFLSRVEEDTPPGLSRQRPQLRAYQRNCGRVTGTIFPRQRADRDGDSKWRSPISRERVNGLHISVLSKLFGEYLTNGLPAKLAGNPELALSLELFSEVEFAGGTNAQFLMLLTALEVLVARFSQ
jgi:hypothetical protein